MPVERLPALLLDDAVPREDGVIANDKPFWGFDGQPATAECGYAVNGRLHAVQGSNRETLYGKLEDKVVARTDGQWIASWWLDKADPLGKARTDISPAGPTSINADAVQIDDAELLGTSGRKPGTLKSTHWSAGVTGGLVATVLGTPVPLRPDRVEHKDSKVIFLERGRGRAGSGQVLAIRWKFAESQAQEQRMDKGLTLKANAALLLDEVADGAWEAGSPLWIRTASGFVRWHSAQGRLSYRTTAESRTVDVTGWLPAFSPNGFARLLLDASGDKTLTVNTATRTAELSIEDPALMIALPRACCNGLQLAVPLLPPDDAAVTSTLCIVSQSLAPSEDLCSAAISLEQTSPSTARLALTATRPAGATQYFAPAGNWVRLAESAANCAAGLARARVLLPHVVKSGEFALLLGQDLEVRGAGEFDAEKALSVALPAVDGEARFVSGPLARFDIKDAGAAPDNYGLEIWPSPLENQASTEPAVLRSLYRRSSAQGSFAADELPPYAATRVVATGIATPTIARSLIENAGTRWHYLQVAPGVEEARLRFAPQQPGKRRGWVEGGNFIGRTPDKPGPIDYLELHGATKHVRNWLRLSNDTLVPRKAALPAVGTPDPAAPGYYEGLGIDPLVTRLGERDAPEERGSLSLFILEETLPASAGGSPGFALLIELGSIGLDPVKIDFDPPKTPVVNRLVIAVANPKFGEAAAKPKQLGDPCRLALTSLNRLYLELEREGSHFIVRRGMLGWNASEAFGLVADDHEPLEVTEMFERRDGALSRMVEFNGALPVVKEPMQEVVGFHNQAYRLTAYFWAATWRFTDDAAASTLRVICYHGWTYGGGTKWFASAQDARVADGRLDLSADLVLMLAEDTRAADSRGTDSPWHAVRRHLYSVVLETPLGAGGQPSNKIAGFLTLRHRAAARFKVEEDPSPRDLQLIPDWRAAERDILPLFSDSPRPARPERLTWLRPRGKQEQRLNAGLGAVTGEALDVVLHAFVSEVPPIASFKLFACCLVGEIGREEGIPRWVPAPLRGGDAPPSRPPALPAGPPPRAMSRLWLFDGPPRMVNEWPDDPAYTPAEVASRTLARLGWTREAVLERDAGLGSEAVTWSVADSPLLNREASIGWFAWPLRAPGDKSTPDEWPQDALPCTRPAPQYEATAPRAFSIEVAFEEDRPVGAKGDMPAATMPILLDLAPREGAGKVSVPIKLRSAGLRAGAWHRLVDYQQKSIKSQMFSPAALPAWGDEGRLATDPKRPGFFSWDERPVGSFRIVRPEAGTAPENSYLLEVPPDAFGVRIIQSEDELLIWTTQDKQGKEVDRTRIYEDEAWDVAGAKRLGIRMPQGAPFRTLLVEFYAKSPAGQAVAVEQRKYFDGGAERLAGIFDDSGQLQAFGSEQVSFYPDEAAPPTVGWKRVAEWQGRIGLEGDMAAWHVATVDIEGRFTLYRHGPLGLLEPPPQ